VPCSCLAGLGGKCGLEHITASLWCHGRGHGKKADSWPVLVRGTTFLFGSSTTLLFGPNKRISQNVYYVKLLWRITKISPSSLESPNAYLPILIERDDGATPGNDWAYGFIQCSSPYLFLQPRAPLITTLRWRAAAHVGRLCIGVLRSYKRARLIFGATPRPTHSSFSPTVPNCKQVVPASQTADSQS
jgi:hypothetical protein